MQCSTCRAPVQRKELASRLSSMPTAIEEVLRYDPPITNLLRVTTRAVRIHGVEIPAGERVALLFCLGQSRRAAVRASR